MKPGGEDRWEAELRALRAELSELKAEQRAMAKSVQDLVVTFRTLAAHLGIAGEPYARAAGHDARDLPGFG